MIYFICFFSFIWSVSNSVAYHELHRSSSTGDVEDMRVVKQCSEVCFGRGYDEIPMHRDIFSAQPPTDVQKIFCCAGCSDAVLACLIFGPLGGVGLPARLAARNGGVNADCTYDAKTRRP
ncbi:MAG: hypothetical protein LBD36_00400 [Holosporales bacterium]|nr:hypothetical protein [Holosporales bacterium]